MESIHKLEKMVEGWLKPLPHLPTEWRKWLAENLWWLTLVGVILSVMFTLFAVTALFAAMAFVGTTTVILGGLGAAATYTGLWYVATIVSMAFLVITLIIEAMAISPLKAMKRKGWDLLFLTVVIGVVSTIVSVVLNISSGGFVGGLLSGIVGAGIGAYVLFEIRSYFK